MDRAELQELARNGFTLSRDRMIKPPDDGWEDRVVVLWMEDECLRSDSTAEKLHETLHHTGAWNRFTGREYRIGGELAKADLGDTIYYLHHGGWVEIGSYQGSGIGVLVQLHIKES